ncbi:hypothetical protein B0T11DRAFT_118549 [Plectosphaerella cucumerina]|uniref:F-box domain-containing protein n=1 Tax=Plectosphaerella cucumerina TaxID=40658 RepID=A0A8K0X0S9_9PEZI|nr:hypothetical protein B0T11DRAFT_118549 [Plectosphaerella cucumerina]
MPRHRRKDPPKNGTGPNPKTGAESHPKNRAGPRQKNGARSSNKNGAGSRPENGAGRHLKNGAGPRPKRRARPTRKQRACRSIDKLPAEVLLQILSDHSIDKDDLKTLRCTSKLFYNVSTELLFRRICISEIWQDTNSFFAIANTPHLAVNVQTVAWTEISGRPAEVHLG